jgi:hypothetical protein
MSTRVVVTLRFPFAHLRQFALPLWCATVVLGGVLLLIVGMFMWRQPAPPLNVPPAPTLDAASVAEGTLHFGVGGRDWKPSELQLSGERSLQLRCRYYLASDACFTIQQGNEFEGKVAKVWWTPDVGVLQLKVGDQIVIRYQDTVDRLGRLANEQRSVEVVPFLFSLFFLASLLTVIGFVRIRFAAGDPPPKA